MINDIQIIINIKILYKINIKGKTLLLWNEKEIDNKIIDKSLNNNMKWF